MLEQLLLGGSIALGSRVIHVVVGELVVRHERNGRLGRVGKHAGLASVDELGTHQGTHHERDGDRKLFLRRGSDIIRIGERGSERGFFVRTHLCRGNKVRHYR